MATPPGAPATLAPGVLGKLELTQQPERTFYKDEGGHKTYYLFVFFVVRAERTAELKKAYDTARDGRGKIPVTCSLVYENTLDEVDTANILQVLGSSREDGEVSESQAEFDPVKGTGSVRYRINKVSMRKDNQGFRLRLSLGGLESVIEGVLTAPTTVMSKRKRLRKEDRHPEQSTRKSIEALARLRNQEVEESLAKGPPLSTPLIHRVLSDGTLTKVPDFPDLGNTKPRPGRDDGSAAKRLKTDGGFASPMHPGVGGVGAGAGAGAIDAMSNFESSAAAAAAATTASHPFSPENFARLSARVDHLEGLVKSLDFLMQLAMPSYSGPAGNGTGAAVSNGAGAGGAAGAGAGAGSSSSSSSSAAAAASSSSSSAAPPKAQAQLSLPLLYANLTQLLHTLSAERGAAPPTGPLVGATHGDVPMPPAPALSPGGQFNLQKRASQRRK